MAGVHAPALLNCKTKNTKMDLEETIVALLSKNGQVRQENDQLKAVLCNVVQENRDLRTRMQSFINDTLEELPGIVSVFL